MKEKFLLLLFIILGLSVYVFAQDAGNKIIVKVTDNKASKSSADRFRINFENNLPGPSSANDIISFDLIIDNQGNSNLQLKIQGANNKRLPLQPLSKKHKSIFEIRENKFLVPGMDSLVLGGNPKFSIVDQESNTIKDTSLKLNYEPGKDKNSKSISKYKIGIIYYDAVYLASPDSNVLVKKDILKYYGYSNFSKTAEPYLLLSPSLRVIADSLLNQFIARDKNTIRAEGTGTIVAKTLSGISPLINSIGNYDVTNLADGIARFLVTRVKEELSIAFFQHFKDVLDKTPTSDLKYLFPTTFDILHSIDREIYNWDNYITTLRDAFDKDISNLVPNLETFEARASLLEKFRENTACHVSARFALYVAKGFVDHVNAGQLLEDFDADEYIRPTDRDASDQRICWITFNLCSAVKTLQLLSSSIRSRDKDQYWIMDSELKELFYNDNLSQCYNLLLWLKAWQAKIEFQMYENDKVHMLPLYKLIDDWNTLKPVVSGFAVKVKDFRSSYTKMKTAIDNAKTDSAKSKISYIDLYPFIQSSVNIIKYTDETMIKLKLDTEIPKLKPVLEATSSVLDLLTKGGELGMDLSLKRYSAVIADLTYLVNGTTRLIKTTSVTTATPDAVTGSPGSTILIVDTTSLKTFTENLIKYGTFMASVANAKSSEEVEKVIQNHALPTGSSRIKRESAFNVSLNAYPGLYVGYERIVGVDPPWKLDFTKVNSYGVTAPIGVAVSWGHRQFMWWGRNWSYSFFVSVIDIGAITSFRFTNDSVASIPTILLKDILSPGLFFSIGIPKCPLSINMGAQIGPNLRTVNAPSKDNQQVQNNYSNNMYLRYSISVCVDIPIFNLANKLDKNKPDKVKSDKKKSGKNK